MRTIWQSLAWKEWHEHKWKFATLAALLCGLSAASLFDDGISENLEAVWQICLIPAAIFLGLEAAAGERSRGTLAFLQALPVPLWRIALTKLAAGISTMLIATFLAFGTVYLWAAGYVIGGQPWPDVLSFDAMFELLIYILLMLGISASLYLWTTATGARRSDEISAAAVSLACILGCWLVVLGGRTMIVYVTDAVEPIWIRTLGLAVAPGGVAVLIPLATPRVWLVTGIVIGCLTHVGLAVWYVMRFGRGAELSVRSPDPAAIDVPNYFPVPPRRSQLTAIVWKQSRESLPIVLLGLGGAAGLVTLTMLIAFLQNAAGEPTNYADWFGHMTLVASMIFGLMVAVVAGMGAYLFDLGDRLSTFWRSRPVSADLWHWTKFFTGLVIVLVAFQLPMLLGTIAESPMEEPEFRQPYALLWQITAYSTAAAGICLVRRPLFAVILGLATLYAAWLVFAVVRSQLFDVDIESEVPLSLAAIGFGLFSVAASIVGWLAVRNGWSWQAGRGG